VKNMIVLLDLYVDLDDSVHLMCLEKLITSNVRSGN
jgi:hypothetical protein